MKLRYKILIGVYVATSILNIGEINGQRRSMDKELIQSKYSARDIFSQSIFLGIVPGGQIAVPFITGFYQYPISYEYRPLPCAEKEAYAKHVWCEDQ
jgi:hypothetical protein